MKTVVVLCLRRTGSSLLAGILHRLGVRMGSIEGLLKGKHTNKHGNYENQDFLDLSISILCHAGSYSFNWIDFPKENKVERAVRRFEKNIKETLRKNERELWGWKDPSAIYTLPYFHKHLTNPHYIFLERDVDSVVKSHLSLSDLVNWYRYKDGVYMLRHMNLQMIIRMIKNFITNLTSMINIFKGRVFRRIIEDGYSRIRKFVRGKKFIHINFSDLVKEPKQTINKIADFLDIKPSPNQIQKALNFIDPDEIHFKKDEEVKRIYPPQRNIPQY